MQIRACVVIALSLVFTLALGVSAARAADTIDVGPDYNDGKRRPLVGVPPPGIARAQAPEGSGSAQSVPPQVGDVRTWLGGDDVAGVDYLKDYVLRGIGNHVEVWTATGLADVDPDDPGDDSTDLDFLPGDCRNGERTQVTDEQIAYFIEQFDSNIYPKESLAFSVPPDRDGTNAILPELVPGLDFTGEGDNIVVLVDNIRDDNFYDVGDTQSLPYIGGFFSSVWNEYFDRNVMTVDAFDWIHRTGANPPDEPDPDDECASSPARPFLYEGTFAHEFQHLLEYYADPDELLWVNEGLSEWAMTLTGYVDPATPITDAGFNAEIQCFLGNLGVQTPANPNPGTGGPENSLTAWGDQGQGDEILCDYGAAYTLMEMLAGRYGTQFMSALHRGEGNGFAGLDEALDAVGVPQPALEVVHDWAAMVALDALLDGGTRLVGGHDRRYTTPTLDAAINWDTTDAYSTSGAPPNGADYVRLRDASGYLRSSRIRSIEFEGAPELPPVPVEWTVDPAPPETTDGLGCEERGATVADPAFASGCAPNLDRAIVYEVNVPTGDPTLTFRTLFQTEDLFDFGFVQISTDGGETYASLGNELTTSDADPTAIPLVQDSLPGLNGDSGGWVETSFDLQAYAGQPVLLAFRYVTDSSVDGAGWWIDDVAVGGEALADGASLDGWRSPTEIRPVPVTGWTVQLVAYSTRRVRDRPLVPAFVTRLRLDGDFRGAMDRFKVLTRLGPFADVVAAIVTYDEPTEAGAQYAPYTLRINGVLQPGG